MDGLTRKQKGPNQADGGRTKPRMQQEREVKTKDRKERTKTSGKEITTETKKWQTIKKESIDRSLKGRGNTKDGPIGKQKKGNWRK